MLNIQTLCFRNFKQKIIKIQYIDLLQNITHFGKLLDLISQYTKKTQRKPLQSILSFYLVVTLCKNSEKVCALIFKTWKTSFLAHHGPLLAQKFQNNFFSKKIIWVNCKSYATVTLCKKSEKPQALTFNKSWKTSFWAFSGPKTCKNLPDKWTYRCIL